MLQHPDFDLADAEWLAHRYVESDDRVRFMRVERARHRTVPFLTDACLGESRSFDMPAQSCLAEASPGPLHFLFHSAFCGSTMLARAFDRPSVSMGLSEPVILNDVVGYRRRGAAPREVARLADIATRLLARPYGPGEAVVVKPSNVVNPLAELMLMLRADSRAIFLYAPLETFLISVARKGLGCRLWVRELAQGYLTESYLDPLRMNPQDIFLQTDLQVAATGWLAQQAHFTRLAAKFGAQRLRSLSGDELAGNPAAALFAVAEHYGLLLDAEAVAEIVSGPTFARHSKSGADFSAKARSEEYAVAKAAHADEIDKVVIWTRAVAEAAGVPLSGPSPLFLAHS